MKKTFYSFLTAFTCLSLLAGCGIFANDNTTEQDNTTIENDTTKTDDELDDVLVTDPSDITTEEQDGQTTEEENDTSDKENPRDNVATDAEKEFEGSGKFYGFIDSNSVEVELDNGTYCTFFVLEENVRETLSNLLEEETASISFTYKAVDGQINPEMTSVTAK